MGISIVLPNTNFKHYVASLTLPNRDGLIAEYILGSNTAKSIINWANQDAPASEVGTPTYSDNYASATTSSSPSSNGWETGLQCPNNVTMIAIARRVSGLVSILAKRDTSTARFSGFQNYTSVPAFYNSQNGSRTDVADFAAPAAGDFFMLAGKGALGGYGKAHLWSAGVRADSTAESAGSDNASWRAEGTLKTGVYDTAGGLGVTDIAYLAMFSRVLGTDELDAAYTSLKAFYDGKIVIS